MRIRIVILVTALLLPAFAGEASAGHTKNCGVIENVKKSRDYRVRAYAVKCRFARRWSRRYIRRGAHKSGWGCSKPGGNISFICRKGDRYYYAQRV